jgi:hypothetical protein
MIPKHLLGAVSDAFTLCSHLRDLRGALGAER